MSPLWISLKQKVTELLSGDNGSYTTCKTLCRMPTTNILTSSFLTHRMLFLSPNRQCQRTVEEMQIAESILIECRCTGRSGLAVACLTAEREVLGSNHAEGSCVYHKNHGDLQPWTQAVCTLPAVPRSTQPSTLRGTVNEYQLFGVSNNNKWRWWL